jgi:general secretion pathway protein K
LTEPPKEKMGETFRNNRGIALLITLSVITVLIASALELHRSVRVSVVAAAVARDRQTLSQMATSGIHLGMAILIKDKGESESDSLQEDWANTEKLSAYLQELSFENGTIDLVVTDELGKIQINSIVDPQTGQYNETQRIFWERVLLLPIFKDAFEEENDPISVIDSIKDWIDSGDDDSITGLNGAETPYYQTLDPPYACRNAPFGHIGEVALVKGVTPMLFNGAGEIPGISNFITVHGMQKGSGTSYRYEGKININTAELPVLAALLPPQYEDLAMLIDEYRREASEAGYMNDLSDPAWYKNVSGLKEVTIDPGIITTASDFFRIDCTAALHDAKLTISAVVEREKEEKTGKWKCRILSWHVN